MSNLNFLSGQMAVDAEKVDLYDLSSNWVKLHEAIHEGRFDEDQIRKLIIIELETRRRPDMLVRMKSYFDKLRTARENMELFGALANGA